MQLERLSTAAWNLTNPGGNYATSGYPTRVPMTTRPDQQSGLAAVGDGVIPMGHDGEMAPGHVVIIPIGTGSATNTFSMKVLGWRATRLNVGLPLWVPVTLATYAITLGSATGVVNSDLGTTTLFATTITSTGGPTFITSGAAPVILDWCQISPGSNLIGMICQASFGFRFLEVVYTTGGSATDCNGLYCKL